jgi:XTP/dITP diphosphohydrolase
MVPLTVSYFTKRSGSKAKGIITMADDSGLSVDSLDGEPGVNSSRYSGPECNDEKNIEKLLKELSEEKKRDAKFITVITLSINGKVIKSFKGEVNGFILNRKRGSGGFGYDSVFYYPPLEKTFAELTVKEKNKISHRSKALGKMKDFLIDFNFESFLKKNQFLI